MKAKAVPETDADFDAYMAEVDERLQADGVAIHARPFLAVREASRDFSQALRLDDSLTLRMDAWFQAIYGDRLQTDCTLGRSVVLINGTPFAVILPVIYGGGGEDVDPLDWVEGLTPALRQRLSLEQADRIRLQVLDVYRAFNLMSHLPRDAVSWADVDTAVTCILGRAVDYGVSRYASSQVAEKALKSLIRTFGGKPPTSGSKGHDLMGLRDIAQKIPIPRLARGHIDIPEKYVTSANAKGGVRYHEDTSTLQEAVDAHYASLALCAHLVTAGNFIQGVADHLDPVNMSMERFLGSFTMVDRVPSVLATSDFAWHSGFVRPVRDGYFVAPLKGRNEDFALLHDTGGGRMKLVGLYAGDVLEIEDAHRGKGLSTDLILATVKNRKVPSSRVLTEAGKRALERAWHEGRRRFEAERQR